MLTPNSGLRKNNSPMLWNKATFQEKGWGVLRVSEPSASRSASFSQVCVLDGSYLERLGAQEMRTTNFKNLLRGSPFSFYLFLLCLYSDFLCLTPPANVKAGW